VTAGVKTDALREGSQSTYLTQGYGVELLAVHDTVRATPNLRNRSALGESGISKRAILAHLVQSGFNPGELVARRVEKASECPEIHVIVRKFTLKVSGDSRYVPILVNYTNFRTAAAWYYERIFLTWAYTVEMTVLTFALRKMTRISGQIVRLFVLERAAHPPGTAIECRSTA